eukprot:TRINITY_DN625_c0_g2_i3.p1 TRINITY_DN625_c0_g2~~TRINITY_DN625_c0_g2_i3.p1  ORF type:complete len:603 (+),score=67.93 TRINITY_DN625_c0_g2_i3:236-2044(+)
MRLDRAVLIVAQAIVLAAAQTYTIDWAAVPATAPTVNSYDALAGNLISICPCDLTSNQCDWNCCCDTTDCSSTAIAMFSHCEGYANTTDRAHTCMNSDTLVYANARGDIDVSTDSSGATCSSLTWDDDAGDKYYQDPGTVTTAEEFQALFDSYSLTPKRYNFTAMQSMNNGRLNRAKGNYLYGDPLISYYTPASTPFYTFFPLPSADSEGDCVDDSNARYLLDTTRQSSFQASNTTCFRRATSLETQCAAGGTFDATKYVYGWQLQVFYSLINDQTTGTLVSVTSANASISWPPPTPTWTAATLTCSNAFAGALWNFTTDATTGEISSVTVDTYLTDYQRTHMDGSIEITQTFITEFHSSTEASTTTQKSGNNGYMPGTPILSGTLTTSGSSEAVLQTVGGLVVPTTNIYASPAHTCVTVDQANASVNFNSPSSSCCMVALTLAELEANCVSSYTPTLPVTTGSYLGVYGSADRYRTSDWIPLTDPTVPSSTTYAVPTGQTAPYWDATTSTCYGILGGSMRLEFEWAYQGSFNQPQPRILAARQVWERQTWRFLSSSTYFPVCVKTAWTEREQDVPEREVDADLVYPLLVGFLGANQLVCVM